MVRSIEQISEDEQHDGVGELVNMIAGGAKASGLEILIGISCYPHLLLSQVINIE